MVGSLKSLSFLIFFAWASGSFGDPSSKTSRSALFSERVAQFQSNIADDGPSDDDPLNHSLQFDDSGVDLKRTLGILLFTMLAAL